MTRVFRKTSAVLLGVASLMLVGCGVPQERYDDVTSVTLAKDEQILQLEDQLKSEQENNRILQQRIRETEQELDASNRNVNTLKGDMDRVQSDMENEIKRILALKPGRLPAGLTLALQDLAGSYSDVLVFDSESGMVRFASDFTFDSGSVELKDQALASIDALGDILNTPEAEPFEIHVIGHTDNYPIGKPATRAKHPTNMHLSVHRAISVRNALINAGIDPVRIQAAGWGETRPIVENGPKGAAENRRVEIFLFPMTDGGSGLPPSMMPDGPSAAAPTIDEPMK